MRRPFATPKLLARICVSVGTFVSIAAAAPPCYTEWKTFDRHDGLPSDKVLCVYAHADEVWAGTDHGLTKFENGRCRTYTTADGLAHPGVLAVARDPATGDIWIATMGGLTRYSAGRFDTFTQLNSGLANNIVYSVAIDDGAVWAATAAGTSRYEIAADRWTIFDETNTPMHEIWCYAAAACDDKIYLGVWGGGLLEYQKKRDHWKDHRDPDGEMEIDLFKDDGLVHDVVASVTCDDSHRVWVATYFGLSGYDGRKWHNFLEHDSPLISNFVNYVLARGDTVWIATDNGLNATDGKDWWSYQRDTSTGGGRAVFTSADGSVETFATATAPPHNYILGISFAGNDIWLATERGLARGTLGSERTLLSSTTLGTENDKR